MSPTGSILVDDTLDVLIDDSGDVLVTDTVSTSIFPVCAFIFQFPSQGATQADEIVGVMPFVELWVWKDLSVNSTVAETGYWPLVTTTDSFTAFILFEHPNLQVSFLQSTGAVLNTAFPTDHFGAIINMFGTYVANGLPHRVLWTDDLSMILTADDGVTILTS